MESLLALLPYLACPVGMGLLMWLMMRGPKSEPMATMPMAAGSSANGQAAVGTEPTEHLTTLRAQLADLRAQQAAIAAQIDRLATEDRPVEQSGLAQTDAAQLTKSTGQSPA